MVPVYHCLYEKGALVLLCVIDRQLEAANISDLVTLEYVCDLKVPIPGGSYLSAASTHSCHVVLLFFFWGGGGMAGMGSPVILYIRLKHACLRRLASGGLGGGGRFKSCSI